MPLMYRLGKILLGPIFKMFYKPKIIGKENLKVDGPIIIAGNHIHLYDQCLAIISTKRYIRYMAKKEYFDNKKTAWFFKLVGCISVDRSKKDPKSKNEAIKTLKSGGAIGIFPEGTRNKTNKDLLPFKYGCVSMASKTNATIIPFFIKGTYKFRSKDLCIRFGEGFKVDGLSLEEANILLEENIRKLMD